MTTSFTLLVMSITVADGVGLNVGGADSDGDEDPEGVTLGEGEVLGVVLELGVNEGDAGTDGETDALDESEGDRVPEGVLGGETDDDAVPDGVVEGVDFPVRVAVDEGVLATAINWGA